MREMKASSAWRGGKKGKMVYRKTEKVRVASDRLMFQFVTSAPNGESIFQVEVSPDDYPLVLESMMEGDRHMALTAVAERLSWLSLKLRREVKSK